MYTLASDVRRSDTRDFMHTYVCVVHLFIFIQGKEKHILLLISQRHTEFLL